MKSVPEDPSPVRAYTSETKKSCYICWRAGGLHIDRNDVNNVSFALRQDNPPKISFADVLFYAYLPQRLVSPRAHISSLLPCSGLTLSLHEGYCETGGLSDLASPHDLKHADFQDTTVDTVMIINHR